MAQKVVSFDLTGKLLISTPAMGDPRFSNSVVYICAHSDRGAFGLVINRPIEGLTLASVLGQLKIPVTRPLPDKPVLAGGPVDSVFGFVLYRGGEEYAPDSEQLADGISVTASPLILADIARGEGPSDWLLALGCSGWGAGQLEAEISQNDWLTCDAASALVFSANPDRRLWHSALQFMGINPMHLSSASGRG